MIAVVVHPLRCRYYRGAVGAMVVYDVSDRTTFDNVRRWLRELRRSCADHVVVFIIGNKSDKARAVTVDEAAALAERECVALLETSALRCDGVEDAFHSLLEAVFDVHGPRLLEERCQRRSTATSTSESYAPKPAEPRAMVRQESLPLEFPLEPRPVPSKSKQTCCSVQ